MNGPKRTCAACGAELTGDDAHAICARCLLQAGMASQTDADATVIDASGTGRHRTLPNVGQHFGSYHIVRQLGRGGMGVVFEAEELDTGRRVALKVLGRQFDSPKDRARFLREGRLAASINHPNSVYVYGTDEIDGTPTIAMELVAGGTLQQRLKEHGPMSVAAAVDAILQIIAGLEAAQAIGILHRDVKPANCFEDTDGTIKIGDFGLSISSAARAEANITATGSVVGTPAFCSPEQLRGDELNARSDMYSVGMTLFYLLTGRVAFEGHNIAQLTANVLEQSAPAPNIFRKEIPKGLSNVILRCLAKQPSERFKSYDDLRQALAPYSSTAPTPATLSLRFLAGMIDLLVLNIISTGAMLLCFGNPFGWLNYACEHSPLAFLWILGALLATAFYYAVFEGIWGAAAGKAICGLRLIGPNKTPPGFLLAALRALIYVAIPALPAQIAYGFDPKAALQGGGIVQALIGSSFYLVLAMLFCTVRRRNGFASVYDLLTNTRVVAKAALESRPVLTAIETPPPAIEGRSTVGPYCVLETLETSAQGQWLLGYDLRLLRKVWIHTVPPGTEPVRASLRNIGRVGRLRWLTGRRAPEENWDAFEGVGGQPLLGLVKERQPWSRVRFWLYDLAREISAAEKDGTLPQALALDRVWITGDGRAKLLDFRAPGLAAADQADATLTAANVPEAERTWRFLNQVAIAALEGRTDVAAGSVQEPAVVMPLHAREFLESLPRFSHGDAVANELRPLLRRTTSVSRWRRAAVIAGCAAFPLFGGLFMMLVVSSMQQCYPGILELSDLMRKRESKAWITKKTAEDGTVEYRDDPVPDQQVAIYIASHYRALVADDASWNSPMTMSLIKDDNRQFVEQCIAEHPAPTEEEIAEADAAVTPHLDGPPKLVDTWSYLPFLAASTLAIYVCLPALIAAILFRGGLVLRVAGITFVRRNGKRASRLRVFWRALVAWSPLWLAPIAWVLIADKSTGFSSHASLTAAGTVPFILYPWLSVLSVALPERGLPDLAAGTWPVPR